MWKRNHGSDYWDLTSKTQKKRKEKTENLTGKVTHRGGLPGLSDLDATLSQHQILMCKRLRPGGGGGGRGDFSSSPHEKDA